MTNRERRPRASFLTFRKPLGVPFSFDPSLQLGRWRGEKEPRVTGRLTADSQETKAMDFAVATALENQCQDKQVSVLPSCGSRAHPYLTVIA